jgi:hypothetical protein
LERSVRQIPCLLLIERLLQLQTQPRERQRLLASLRKLPGIGEDALHYLAARTALDDGNFDGAAAELDKIKSREHPALTRLWADVHRQRGSVREALRAYTQLADGDPQRFGGYPCSLCERIPRSPGSRIPTCKYWDGIRSLSSVE